MPILFAFTLFALLDFVILFSVGAQIGLLMTLLLILGTGFLGLHLVRREGLATFQRAQQRLATLRDALVAGESSGESRPLDMASIKAVGRERAKAAE